MAMARTTGSIAARTDRVGAMVIGILLLVNIVTAVAVVYSRHHARSLFVELESLKAERDRLAVEWDRLQLEEGTFATHNLIERKARAKLGMAPPDFEQVEHLTP